MQVAITAIIGKINIYAKNGINELTDSQKELIDRLSKQYGAK